MDNPEKLGTLGIQDEEKHNTLCVGHHYTQTNTNNVNKTWAVLLVTEGIDESNIVLMRKIATDITNFLCIHTILQWSPLILFLIPFFSFPFIFYNQCLAPQKLWVWILLRRGVLETTLCDSVSDLWQVGGFLRVIWFHPPIKLTTTI